MPQITLTIPNFSINSTFHTYNIYGSISYSTPTTGKKTFSFATSQIPAGSVINSALLNASWGGSLYGGTAKQAGSTSKTNVDVTSLVAAGVDTPIEYTFKSSTGGSTDGDHSSTLSFSDCQMVVNYTLPNSAPGNPPWASVSPSLYESGQVNISWGAASDAEGNITGYRVQWATSNDGANWTGFSTLGTFTGTGASDTPGIGRGAYEKYQVCAIDAYGAESGYTQTNAVRRNSLPNVPGSLRFHIGGGGYFYSSLQCLWNNGGDPDGNFSGVYIRLARYNHDSGAGAVGWAWLDTNWVWLDNVSSFTITRAQLAAKGAKAGDAIAFGLVAQDTLSAQNWDAAGMTASGYVYLAADPTAPSTFTASPAIQESGVTLSWSGANGNGIAIAGYDIEYKTSSTSGGAEGTDGYAAADGSPYSTSYASGSKTDPAVISRGYYERWRIRTRNADGAVSGWAYSNITRKNSAPAAPDVTAPVSLKTIYNSQPRILAAVGSDADAHSQTLAAAGYTASSGGAQAPGRKLVLRKSSAAAAGSQTVSVTSTDIMGVLSSAAARSFTYAVPAWTDPGLTAGETPVKAVHMTELRAAADNVRAYYGMAAYPWAGAITAGITGIAGWTGHVAELRTAIEQVASLVNGWDTTGSTNDIALPAWIAINENRPSAAVIAQLRDVIPLL